MSLATQLYPNQYNETSKYNFGPYDYQPIIENFGDILIQVDDRSYSGDTRVLLKGSMGYGVLIFGWGSCSGCDSLQACSSYDEIDELITDIYNDIIWFSTLDSCKVWAENRDWELQYSWHQEETKEFVDQLLNYKL